jgi:GxxExxY protein
MRKLAGDKVLYPELSFKIMQVIFEVHNKLGPGFTEDIYEEATVYDLQAQQILLERQKPIQVIYKNRVIGTYRLDLVIEEKIILELKAVTALNDLFRHQVLSYLKATNLHLGILINFGAQRVEYIRIINKP